MSPSDRYTRTAVVLHWLIAALLLVEVAQGWLMQEIPNPPPPMVGVARWQMRAAKTNHAILYIAMLVLPLSGYLGSVFSGYPIKWFGVTLPSWGTQNASIKDLMSTVHYVTSWVLVASTALHIAGAVKHELAGEHV